MTSAVPLSTDELRFERPAVLAARAPAESRGVARDEVRLLVSSDGAHRDHVFRDLPDLLEPGDVLVVNRSATLPASLPASGPPGSFLLNLSTRYADRLWLAEPRWTAARPGPVGLDAGDTFKAAGVQAKAVAPHPGLSRLWFVAFAEPVEAAMRAMGRPIHYEYLDREPTLDALQTVFGDRPGSAEMPSAARPFTSHTLDKLAARGVEITPITLHTGVSSLEFEGTSTDEIELYAEPFEVPSSTAAVISAARSRGSRVVAVGTTVVRALESAVEDGRVVPKRGFTRRVVRPGRHHGAVDALLTGLHDSGTSHLAMLVAVAGRERVFGAYHAAVARGYLWHEFGDVHLLWRNTPGVGAVRLGSV